MNIKEILSKRLGIDGAVFYTLAGRSLQILTAFFTVFFVARYLSPDEQGYYYTFGSIVGIQVFFELGLTTIITQFVAHEKSHLEYNENYELIGDEKYKSRLSSLLRFCGKWYVIIGGIFLLVLIVAGIVYFNHFGDLSGSISWELPWILLAIGTVFNLFLSPITAFLEGLGKVKEIAQIRLVQQVIHPIVVWGGLAAGSKLFVSGADAVLRVLVVSIILVKSPYFRILKQIWKSIGKETVNYLTEVFPYQWRIALSWISGYFIYQLFNPVLFATEGAIVAGQMGMTLAALNGIQALSTSWINTKVPLMSEYIARKEYNTLDVLFKKTLLQMVSVGVLLTILFIIIIYALNNSYYEPLIHFSERFLPLPALCLITVSFVTMLPVNAWAAYLRCHKKEPLLANSITIGILCCLVIFVLGSYKGLIWMLMGYLIIRIFSMAWTYFVYINKKTQWHG